MSLLAIVPDTLVGFLEIIDKYGADKVFMVWFFWLYRKAIRRNESLQDKRIDDNKEALRALIEAKHVFAEMSKHNDELTEAVRSNEATNKEAFGRIRGKLNKLIDRQEVDDDS